MPAVSDFEAVALEAGQNLLQPRFSEAKVVGTGAPLSMMHYAALREERDNQLERNDRT
jgi:hypothetical protein